MDLEFEEFRNERRSFACSNKLWKELKKRTKGCLPVSRFIRLAIIEKLKRDFPDKEDYFDDISR